MDEFIYEDTKIKLYNEDCLKIFPLIDNESIDLIITSPPYCMGKEYENTSDDINSLKICNGPQNYNFYSSVFKDWDFSFENSKDKNKQFPYAGAQYSKFAKNEIIPLFVRKYNTVE